MNRIKRILPNFRALMKLDFKRAFCKRNMIVFACFLGIALYLVQLGVNEYRLMEAEKADYQQVEALRFSLQENSSGYRGSGIRFFFMPSPNSIFFGSSPILKRIQGTINDKAKLDVHASLLNGSAFDGLSVDFLSYSGFIIYAGSLLFLLFGYDTGRDREYTKFLTAVSGGMKRVTGAIYLSRLLLIILFTVVVSGAALLTAVGSGIQFPWKAGLKTFTGFSGVLIMYNYFFFLLGTAAGSIRSKHWGIGTLAASWLILLFVIPGVMGKYIAGYARRNAPAYRLEMKELYQKALTSKRWGDWMKNSCAQLEKYIGPGLLGKTIEDVWNRDVNEEEIKRLESEVSDDLWDTIELYHEIFAFSPVTLYLSMTHEISSRGFYNFYEFYMSVRMAKPIFEDLTREVTKRPVPIDSPRLRLITDLLFVKKNGGLVYYAGSHVPGDTPWPVTQPIFILVMASISIFFFEKSIYASSSRFVPGVRHLEIAVAGGEMRMFKAPAPFIDRFFSHVSRESKGDFGKLSLAGEDIGEKDTKKFIYLGGPDCLPGHMRVRSFIPFFQRTGGLSPKEKEAMNALLKPFRSKRFRQLSEDGKAEVILALVRFSGLKLVVLVDFVNRVTLEGIRRVNKQLEGLSAEGVTVLYFNTYPTYDPPLTFGGCTLVNESEGRYELTQL